MEEIIKIRESTFIEMLLNELDYVPDGDIKNIQLTYQGIEITFEKREV